MTTETNGTAPTNANTNPAEGVDAKMAVRILAGTGLSIWKGIVSEEYLPELRPWTKAYKVITEMQDDVVLGTLLESVITPLLDAPFEIRPASDSDADMEAAQWLEANTIKSERFSWLDHVEEIMYEFNP